MNIDELREILEEFGMVMKRCNPIGSCLYWICRLQKLQGPSVAEFKVDADLPWSGQRLGF